MSDPYSPPSVEDEADDRLDSWKAIAAYLKRDVTTVQRWEKREGMPVHRHVHDKIGSVYAFRGDLDAWTRSRRPADPGESIETDTRPGINEPAAPERIPERVGDDIQPAGNSLSTAVSVSPRRWPGVMLLSLAVALVPAGLFVWQLRDSNARRENPLAGMRFQQLTDSGGTTQSAAISRDGKFVAFLSDRDGRVDVWVTQVGTGQFYNLTRDAARELVNPDVRTIGFSADGSLVTFWTRRSGAHPPEIGVWAVPVLGGSPRPYLDGVAEFDWSGDGARLVYHTPGPGDPMFVRDSADGDARPIFSAPAGLHSHFLVWSPDQRFIYFVQGAVPDRMDIWRIAPAGGIPERMTNHEAPVSYPVFLDARTLAYLATDPDGSGPWLQTLDVEDRVPRRASVGIDRYTSLAASADGRRLVATVARPASTLWRIPVSGTRAEMSAARRIPLTTSGGSSPRYGPGYLLYVSSKGTSDSIWRLHGEVATEVWSAPETRVVGGPAIAQDGRMAFTTARNGRTFLHVANADGTDARVLAQSLELQGAPAWAPDGHSLTVAALVGGVPHLFRVPSDGGSPAAFLEQHAMDPAWSPDGDVVVYSGADIGTTFPVMAVTADARAAPLPALTLTRGARHLVFMPGQRSLVVLRGELRHKNLWLVDLDTGAERQVTDLAPDFEVRDFDVAPDGNEIVLEHVEERSDIVLLDLPPR